MDKIVSLDDFRDALLELQLLPPVTLKELKKSYKDLSRVHHPDLGGDARKFFKIQKSYQFLKQYIDNFSYSFDQDEIEKQHAELKFLNQFRPF